jgi:hypothetical protein
MNVNAKPQAFLKVQSVTKEMELLSMELAGKLGDVEEQQRTVLLLKFIITLSVETPVENLNMGQINYVFQPVLLTMQSI